MQNFEQLIDCFHRQGESQYGGECINQREHALQTAWLAEQSGASGTLVAAALLHDVGHLLHHLPNDAPDKGIDDVHEQVGYDYLCNLFPDTVTEPVRLHVDAKRYLCAADSSYYDQLSPPSVTSLHLQGGPMSQEEAAEFEANAHFQDAVSLRRWDDLAKDPERQTPPLDHYTSYLIASLTPEARHANGL